MAYYGLGADLTIRQRDSDTAALQHELQRLGFLVEGTGRFGADGIWGERTAGALRAAARYVRWTQAPYSPPDADRLRSGTVRVPDDLISRLRSARPAPSGTPGAVAPDDDAPVEPPRRTIGPHLDPAEPPPEGGNGDINWWPAALVGGGLLAIGGILAVTMKKKRRVALAANRRRRRRRRRR